MVSSEGSSASARRNSPHPSPAHLSAQWNDDCTAPGDYSYGVSVRPYGRVLQGGGTRQQARRKGGHFAATRGNRRCSGRVEEGFVLRNEHRKEGRGRAHCTKKEASSPHCDSQAQVSRSAWRRLVALITTYSALTEACLVLGEVGVVWLPWLVWERITAVASPPLTRQHEGSRQAQRGAAAATPARHHHGGLKRGLPGGGCRYE
ncbi:hypothetical protein O3P69_020431 [Scylla paramamosain]|uniref:Uncharacterized protein n=1 Tax=Scylla paramamosain TaxID=85552 RepID=A0AAW0TP47_SCYPA